MLWKQEGDKIESIKPSEELAYVLGVHYGDGYATTEYRIGIRVKDEDFAEEFNRCISKVLHKENLCSINRGKDGRFSVQVSNREFHKFLKEPLEEHKPIGEKFPLPFLRGFFDSEGCVSSWVGKDGYSRNSVEVSNTNLAILEFVRDMLARFSIPMNIRLSHRETETTKNLYQLGSARRENLLKFREVMRFTIKRKQQKLAMIPSQHRTYKHAICGETFEKSIQLAAHVRWCARGSSDA